MPNPIVHFDICGPEISALSSFYREVCGWEITSQGPGYSQIDTGKDSLRGALQETPSSGLNIGIQVDDLAASVRMAEAGGGTVVMPPTDNGWVLKAQVTDPAGNRITLIQSDRDPASDEA